MSIKVASRIEELRQKIKYILEKNNFKVDVEKELIRSQEVATFCGSVAVKRNVSAELAMIIGMLHNISYIISGVRELNSYNSEEYARIILEDLECFTDEEKLKIRQGVFRQNDLSVIDDMLDEVIKDAIILSDFMKNREGVVEFKRVPRLTSILEEFKMNYDFKIEVEPQKEKNDFKDKRSNLANIAEKIYNENPTYENKNNEILRYFIDQDNVSAKEWNIAFVYHCCIYAGFALPIKYPMPINKSFLRLDTWKMWAELKENNFYYEMCESSKKPSRGDIAVIKLEGNDIFYEHIGIIVGTEEDKIIVIEGDQENKNNILKKAYKEIFAVIRISEYYKF